jgi:hypothetical protein
MVLDLFSGLDMRANRMSIQENAEALFRVPRRSKLFGHYQLQDIACATDITRFWWLVNALSWQPTERTIQYNVLLLHIAFKLNIMDIERDMKRVSNRIYRAFYPGIYTDKTICYAVITEEDEQQLLDRMRPGWNPLEASLTIGARLPRIESLAGMGTWTLWSLPLARRGEKPGNVTNRNTWAIRSGSILGSQAE